MGCVNCACDECEAGRNRDLEFGLQFPCEYCGELGMSTATTLGWAWHRCPEKTAAFAARREAAAN